MCGCLSCDSFFFSLNFSLGKLTLLLLFGLCGLLLSLGLRECLFCRLLCFSGGYHLCTCLSGCCLGFVELSLCFFNGGTRGIGLATCVLFPTG